MNGEANHGEAHRAKLGWLCRNSARYPTAYGGELHFTIRDSQLEHICSGLRAIQGFYTADLVSCLRNTFHNTSRPYDRLGAWGSLFSFTTIYPEVVERPTIFLHIMKQPHEQYTHSEGHSLCLSTERCPLWGR
jgi:hypothetical protein